MSVAPYIALGAAGLARELLAQRDPQKRTSPPTDSHIAAVTVAVSGKPMPCGVAQITDHGFKTIDFNRHFLIQRDSLRAAFGDAIPGLVGNITRVPRITRKCAEEWCRLWLDIYLDALKGNKGDELHPAANGLDLLDRFAEVNRQAERARTFFDGDPKGEQIYTGTGEVIRAIANLANAMDSAIHVNLASGLPTFVDLLGESAKNRAADAGDSLAFVIENLLAPIAGAGISASLGVLGSALAPYLILGGATYFVYKRRL